MGADWKIGGRVRWSGVSKLFCVTSYEPASDVWCGAGEFDAGWWGDGDGYGFGDVGGAFQQLFDELGGESEGWVWGGVGGGFVAAGRGAAAAVDSGAEPDGVDGVGVSGGEWV